MNLYEMFQELDQDLFAKTKVKKRIDLGPCSDYITQFISNDYLFTDKENNVFIEKDVIIFGKFTDNGCFEIFFEDGLSSYEIMLDIDEEYEEHLEILEFVSSINTETTRKLKCIKVKLNRIIENIRRGKDLTEEEKELVTKLL